MMMILVGLIFFVVGFNVFHSLRRSVHERMEEIAVLKAVGVPPRRIRTTFILQGLFIGTTGGAAGLLAGLAPSVNVNEVFSAVEHLVNVVMMIVRTAGASICPGRFRGRVFDILSCLLLPDESAFPRVPPGGISRVVLCGGVLRRGRVGSLARRVALPPSEVLRYE